MASLQEKENLVEQIKGPRYYRITLSGYGGEAEYISLTKQQHHFWDKLIKEHGDSDAVEYCVNSEEDEYEFENIDSIPPEADFLMSPDADGKEWRGQWYEAPTSYSHQYGVDFYNAHICVDELSSSEYNATVVKEVAMEDLDAFVNKVDEDMSIVSFDEDESITNEPAYTLQMWSAEKGTFFDGMIETYGEFDPKKLMIYCTEYVNGDSTVSHMTYDEKDVDNQGGDTRGKGYTVSVWDNVQ